MIDQRHIVPVTFQNEEVGYILDLGTTFRGGEQIDSLKELLAKDYDAIFVGTGAPRVRDIDMRQNPNAAAQMRAPIYEEKVCDLIFDTAKVTDTPITKEELLKEDDDI